MSKKCFAVQKYDFRRKFAVQMEIFRRIKHMRYGNHEKNEIVLYQPNETIRLEVRVENETVWLSQAQMADLFGTGRQAITKHIKNIYECGELQKEATCSILELVRLERKRSVSRWIEFYNLDVIISVGYRVNTLSGIHFRQWALSVLKDHLLKG